MTESLNSEGRAARRLRKRKERLLPDGLRAQTWSITSDYHAQGAIDFVLDRMRTIAAARGFARRVQASGFTKVEILPVYQRMILRELEATATFRGELRSYIHQQLRLQHVLGVDPEARLLLPKLGVVSVPEGGVLRVRSSLRLGSAAALESEPEGWDHWCIDRIVRAARRENLDELDDRESIANVLVLGSNAGGLARCAESIGSIVPRLAVTERDWIFQAGTNVPCSTAAEVTGHYDAVVLVMPSPATGGASTHRRIYNQGGRLAPFDPSSLGPTKWRAALGAMLSEVADRLCMDGTAYLLVPSSVRSETGYAYDAALVGDVDGVLAAVGLVVVERLEIVELDPVPWPFVAERRPKRLSLTVRRGT